MLFFRRKKSYVSLTACVSDDYKNALKIREIESKKVLAQKNA